MDVKKPGEGVSALAGLRLRTYLPLGLTLLAALLRGDLLVELADPLGVAGRLRLVALPLKLGNVGVPVLLCHLFLHGVS